MKRTPLFALALALIAVLTFTLMTQQTATADDHKGGEAGEKLHELMEDMGGTYREVRRSSRDASKNVQTAAKLAHMIELAVESKKHIPVTATTDDLKSTYRVTLNKLILVLSQAENAALKGNMDDLKKYVLEANHVKGEGHELFIADDDDD